MKQDRSIPTELLTHMETLAGLDQRVGQVFENIRSMIKCDGKNPFFIENDEMAQYFRKAAKSAVVGKNEVTIRALILEDTVTSAQSIEFPIIAQETPSRNDSLDRLFKDMIAGYIHNSMINWEKPFSRWSPPPECLLKYYDASKEEPWFEETITVKDGDREEKWKVKVTKCHGGKYVG